MAELGNSDAQYLLAMMYGKGQYVKMDTTIALYWFSKAANQGNADAQFWYGVAYLTGGDGVVVVDYEKAFHWLSKAAEKGVSNAQLCLGIMYDLGAGVIQDSNKAMHWSYFRHPCHEIFAHFFLDSRADKYFRTNIQRL
jgi:TPR repeat protein